MLRYAQTRSNEEWSQMTAAELMGSIKYDRHLQRFRRQLQSQRDKMKEAITRYFPLGTRLDSTEGGMTLWVELPKMLSSAPVFHTALQEGILIAPGSLFSNSNRFDHFLRINCGGHYSEEVDVALRKLGKIVMRLLSGTKPG